MKKWLSYLIAGFSYCSLFGQSIEPTDTLVVSKAGLNGFVVVDTFKVETYAKTPISKSFIYVNGNPIDSTRIWSIQLPIYHKNVIYFNSNETRRKELKIAYTFTGLKEHYSNVFSTDNGLCQLFRVDNVENSIFLVDPRSGKEVVFCNSNELNGGEGINGLTNGEFNIENVSFMNSECAIVEVCTNGDESCTHHVYFLIKQNESKNITNDFQLPYSKVKFQNEFINVQFVDSTKGYLRLKYEFLGNIDSDSYTESKLLNTQLKQVGNVLNMSSYAYEIKGYNIQHGVLRNYYLNSQLYNGKPVIVSYRFDPELDIMMYKVYSNVLVSAKELSCFGSYGLSILRNLIFAKQNYDFSSEFYQAYFNLFAFYNNPEMRKLRTKDVNAKLTEVDKANLKLIEAQETRVTR